MPNHIMSYYHAIYHAMLYFAIHHATILKAGMAWCKEQILVDKAIIKVAHAPSPRCFAKLSDKICNEMQISNMLSLKTSSLPFKSCQLVAFIVKCNIIMFLWLSLTLNPIQGGGGTMCPPCHVFAYTRVFMHIHAPIFFDNSSFWVRKWMQHCWLQENSQFCQENEKLVNFTPLS